MPAPVVLSLITKLSASILSLVDDRLMTLSGIFQRLRLIRAWSLDGQKPVIPLLTYCSSCRGKVADAAQSSRMPSVTHYDANLPRVTRQLSNDLVREGFEF